MTREIAGSLNTRYVIDSTVQATVAVTDGRVLLWLLDEEGSGLELAYDSSRGAVPPLEAQCNLGVGVVGRSARYGQISRGDPDTDDESAVAVPLVVGARVIGVLECFDGVEGEVDGQALSAVEMLATLSGSAIEASRLHAATERLSQFDPLTQLANRRRLGADLDNAVANAKRHGHPMSVIMLDLDHFKELNDRYGHQQGDVVLQEVASTLRASMRDGETAYRYGGGGVAILINQGGPDEAAPLGERAGGRGRCASGSSPTSSAAAGSWSPRRSGSRRCPSTPATARGSSPRPTGRSTPRRTPAATGCTGRASSSDSAQEENRVVTIDDLMRANLLGVFGERDPVRRKA